ncbi:MAG: hypothetical protein CMP67_07740 [Flavobacteriales bacterium]|nr:hypothetical protein [Flavobacteriales bacterium]MBO72946.1 hypothetical protein [Flavobacteriales bacterium]
MSSSNYKMLSSNEIGNVLFCEQNQEMIIGIGTFILKFKDEQPKIFLKALLGTKGEYDSVKNHLIEKVFLKTPVSNMMLALSWIELNKSIDLLQMAFLNLKANEILTVKI